MSIELILGDALELLPDVCPTPALIVTDPPYGTGHNGYLAGINGAGVPAARTFIAGDWDTSARDHVLAIYPDTPAVVFGAATRQPPPGAVQALTMLKPPDSGAIAARGGWRRDTETVYLCGPWPIGAPARSSIIATAARIAGSRAGIGGRYGHPHAKPLDVLCRLIESGPPGLVLDPFAGSGTTLLAARLLGRDAVGIEIDPRWHTAAQANMDQGVLA